MFSKTFCEDCVTLKEEVNNGANNSNSKADDFAEVARMVVKILKKWLWDTRWSKDNASYKNYKRGT